MSDKTRLISVRGDVFVRDEIVEVTMRKKDRNSLEVYILRVKTYDGEQHITKIEFSNCDEWRRWHNVLLKVANKNCASNPEDV